MIKSKHLFSFAAVAFMALALANPAFAATAGDAGETALATLSETITGNIGLMLGLGITILGLWTWIIGQKTGPGVTMIVGGVLLTLAPGMFNGARNVLGGVVEQFSGDEVNKVSDTYEN